MGERTNLRSVFEEVDRKENKNNTSYKERMKMFRDKKIIKPKEFREGDKVLLFNSSLKLFPGKLRSRWSGPFEVSKVFPYDTLELTHPEKGTFKVNSHKVKLSYSEGFEQEVEKLKWLEIMD